MVALACCLLKENLHLQTDTTDLQSLLIRISIVYAAKRGGVTAVIFNLLSVTCLMLQSTWFSQFAALRASDPSVSLISQWLPIMEIIKQSCLSWSVIVSGNRSHIEDLVMSCLGASDHKEPRWFTERPAGTVVTFMLYGSLHNCHILTINKAKNNYRWESSFQYEQEAQVSLI